jgi:hypothetical protein
LDEITLLRTAGLITRRNLADNVLGAAIEWHDDTGFLRLVYYTKGAPTEDAVEWCELTMTELIAEFTEIRTCDTECIGLAPGEKPPGLGLVYKKP